MAGQLWFYALWVPAVLILYSATAYLAKLNNLEGGKWFWALVFVSMIQIWPIVSRFSSDVLFDALLYDFCLLAAQYVTFVAIGYGAGFSLYQWIGFALVIAGFVLLRVE